MQPIGSNGLVVTWSQEGRSQLGPAVSFCGWPALRQLLQQWMALCASWQLGFCASRTGFRTHVWRQCTAVCAERPPDQNDR